MGQVQIGHRLRDEEMRKAIDERAERIGISRAEWINRALEWALSQPVTDRSKKERV